MTHYDDSFQLEGYRGPGPVPVHVFVANEKGPSVKPHVFFRSKMTHIENNDSFVYYVFSV